MGGIGFLFLHRDNPFFCMIFVSSFFFMLYFAYDCFHGNGFNRGWVGGGLGEGGVSLIFFVFLLDFISCLVC